MELVVVLSEVSVVDPTAANFMSRPMNLRQLNNCHLQSAAW
jgi:hypothetical protein